MNSTCLYIITGVNRGLGEAIFNTLKEDNKAILAISRRFSLEQKATKNIKLIRHDLSKPFSTNKKELFLNIINTFQKIVFINNASVIKPIGIIGNFDNDEIIKTYFLNSIAPVLLVNMITKNKNKNLTVLNVSSGAAKRSIKGWALYCATKAANEMFFNTIEGGNVKIINYNPGVIDTNMQTEIRSVSIEKMPNVASFKNLLKENKLKKPLLVAQEIINLIS